MIVDEELSLFLTSVDLLLDLHTKSIELLEFLFVISKSFKLIV